MKNIILTTILIFSSLSFAKQSATNFTDIKENVPVLVDFLTKNLKLNSKQKAVVMNAYSEYANQILISKKKLSGKIKEDFKKSSIEEDPRATKDAYNALQIAEKKTNLTICHEIY